MDIITLRMNLLGGMNSYIIDVIGDEDIYERWWMVGVPDGADEDTLREIAEDEEEFNRICKVFGNLINDN